MATLTIVYWRDIPAQVIAKAGRTTAKRVLPERFEKAIDQSAMRAKLRDTDSYLEHWRRSDPIACGDDLEAEAEALATRLMQSGVPAGALLNVADVLEHPHTQHRQMVVEKDGYRGTGLPIKLARTPGTVRNRPPLFGQDSRAVLLEAGYGEAEIDAMADAGIVVKDKRSL